MKMNKYQQFKLFKTAHKKTMIQLHFKQEKFSYTWAFKCFHTRMYVYIHDVHF